MDSERIIAALRQLANLCKRPVSTHNNTQAILNALRRLSEQTIAHKDDMILSLERDIQCNRLVPLDPMDLQWNIFQLFGVEDNEVRWTQWLAGILRPESGQRLSALSWQALCDALARSGSVNVMEPWQEGRLITSDHWKHFGDMELQREAVQPEYEVADLGQADLLIETSGLVLIIENKLWSGWSGETQADRYRNIIKEKIEGHSGKSIGLVLLAVKPEEYDPPDDYFRLSYQRLALALRRQIRLSHLEAGDTKVLMELWPAFLTVTAIERELLEIDWGLLCGGKPDISRIIGMTKLLDYLQEANDKGGENADQHTLV